MDLEKNQRQKRVLTEQKVLEAISCQKAGDRLKINEKTTMKKEGIKIEKRY